MSRNGERKPPDPDHPVGPGREAEEATGIWVSSTGASESEVAAIVAAVEQFLLDTAPMPVAERTEISPWARAALEEGIAARQVSGYVWGHAPRLR
jgi:hypothetical protein